VPRVMAAGSRNCKAAHQAFRAPHHKDARMVAKPCATGLGAPAKAQ
jgi:hypothetical protein